MSEKTIHLNYKDNHFEVTKMSESHYVKLTDVVLPGYYVARLETSCNTEYQTVRVDLTMVGDGTKEMHMVYNNGANVQSVVRDTATFFGPLPLE